MDSKEIGGKANKKATKKNRKKPQPITKRKNGGVSSSAAGKAKRLKVAAAEETANLRELNSVDEDGNDSGE